MIAAVQSYSQNNNFAPGFGAKFPKRKVIVECLGGKQVTIDKPIVKPVKADSLLENMKHMFFEAFPKLDPEYKKVFGKLDKKV